MKTPFGRFGSAVLLPLLVLAPLAACSPAIDPIGPPSAAPVDTAPATSAGSPSTTPSSADPSRAEPSTSASPTQPVTKAPERVVTTVAAFNQSFAFADGVQVKVTKIRRTSLGAGLTARHVKQGAPVQVLTFRVTNGSGTKLALRSLSGAMTYGTHRVLAPVVHQKGVSAKLGTLRPGKSKTTELAFAVPQKYLNAASLRLRLGATHAPAVFKGSLDYTPVDGAVFNDPTGSTAEQLAITTHIERSIDAAPPGSTIRIAHYSFDIERSAEKLVAAHQRGVHIQMIVDQHNQIVTKQTRTMIKVLGTNKAKKSFIVRCLASCMSNHASAMHAKFYLFSRVGSARLVSMVSSANITHTNSQGSWNDIQTIVGNATIYGSLKKYFVDMVPDKNRPHYYRRTVSGPYELFFFPRASQKRVVLLAVLEHVTCSGAAPGYGTKNGHTIIDVTMYSWRGSRIDIAKKLWSLHNQGCDVRIILNSGRTDLAIKRVLTKKSAKYGRLPIRDAWVDRNGNNVAERYMHEKGITIDGVWEGKTNTKVVYSGSQNFAPASTTDNNELIMRHTSDSTYDAYAKNFAYIRKHTPPLW